MAAVSAVCTLGVGALREGGSNIKRGRAGRTWVKSLLTAGLIVTLTIPAAANAAIVQKTAWGSTGSGDGQLYGPHGIATDPAGHVYVVDNGNNRM